MARSKRWLIVTVQLKQYSEKLRSSDQEADSLSLPLDFGLLGFPPAWLRRVRQPSCCTCSHGQGAPRILRSSTHARFYSWLTPLLAGTTWVRWTAALLRWQNALKIAGGSPSFHIGSSWMQLVYFFFSFSSLFCPLKQYLKTMQWACQLCFSFGLPFHLHCPCLWWWPVNHLLPLSIFKELAGGICLVTLFLFQALCSV